MNLFKNDVRFDGEEFVVERNRGTAIRVRWLHIREIFGYKREPFSVDQVCLGFRVDDSDYHVWVAEDDHGCSAFFAEVERRFGFSAEWYRRVVHPPLLENRRTLWRRG